MGIFVGLDPGGPGRFGWAVLSGDALPLTLTHRGVADHAREVIDTVVAIAGEEVTAVGVDAPLFWQSAGDRQVDQLIRNEIRGRGSSGSTVNAVNSMPGACLIQGIMSVMLARRSLAKDLPVTEAHPKALLWLLGVVGDGRHPRDIGLADLHAYIRGTRIQGASDHERDAALGAITSFAMSSRMAGWQDLYAREPNAITPLDPAPQYWMPIG